MSEPANSVTGALNHQHLGLQNMKAIDRRMRHSEYVFVIYVL